MNKLALVAVVFVVAACGGSSKPAASPGAMPSCDALSSACHPHEEHTALAKECHELGHKAPSEETCAARKAECLAACPADGSAAAH